ncbi:MAG: GDP-L-fucose synthase [Rhodospirillales bacterium]|nr:GDP-L-fucose synthase [Rhodospirillales bacterium]
MRNKKIWVAGHSGMVGDACVRRLAREDCDVLTVSHADLDLRRQAETEAWLTAYKPDAVIVAAAKVGGIMANATQPADFLYDNLAIETNIIHGAYKAGVEKLLFLGSSCIYPREAPQPIAEGALLTGPLEPTNEPYAIAKIAGIKLCQSYRRQYGCDFISAMPCNLYGPGDTYHAENSHVIPALMMKLHAAKAAGQSSVTLWGTGHPLREFLHVDDLADALVFLLKHYADEPHINIGSGQEITIAALAGMVAGVVGYDGEIVFDPSKPDGTPRKLMDNTKVTAMGWQPITALQDGIEHAYVWYLENCVRRDAA